MSEINDSNVLNSRQMILRVILSFLAGLVLVLATIYLTNKHVNEVAEINTTIDNVLGVCDKQKTLALNVSNNVVLLTHDDPDIKKKATSQLDSVLAQFQASGQAIELGSAWLSNKDANAAEIDSIITKLEPIISTILINGHGILEGINEEFFLNNVLELEEPLFFLLDQLIDRYEKLSLKANSDLEYAITLQYWTVGGIVVLAGLMIFVFTFQLVIRKIGTHSNQAGSVLESKEHYERLINGTNDMVYELDGEGHFIYVNMAVKRIVGYTLDDLPKKWFEYVPEKYRQEAVDNFVQNFKNGAKHYYSELPIICSDGSVKWLGQTVNLIMNKDGGLHRVYNIAKDITDVKNANEKEEKYKEGLKLLNELNAKAELSIQERLEYGLRLCSEFLKLDVGIISEIWMDEYKISVFYPKKSGLEINQKFKLGRTYCDITLGEKGKVLCINHMGLSPHKGHPCFKDFKLESYI